MLTVTQPCAAEDSTSRRADDATTLVDNNIGAAPPVDLTAGNIGDEQPKRKRRQRWYAIAAAGVATLLAVFLFARPGDVKVPDSSATATNTSTPGVGEVPDTATVKRQDLVIKLQLPASSVALSALVAAPDGVWVTPAVADGTRVAKGEPVLTISPDPEAVSAAEQAVADAEVALTSAKADVGDETQANATAEQDAQTAVDRAQADLDAVQNPVPDPNAVSTAQRALEDAEAALTQAVEAQTDVATATRTRDRAAEDLAAAQNPPVDRAAETAASRALDDAKRELETAQNAPSASDQEVDVAQTTLERAQQTLTQLRDSASTVNAPIAGVVHFDAAKNAEIIGGYAIAAGLAPLQQLRLSAGELSASASIESATGMVQMECESVSVDSAAVAAAPADDTGAAATTAQMVCVPSKPIPEISGLNGLLNVSVTLGRDLLVVPDIAIEYVDQVPTVTLTDGSTVEVQLGLSDGVLRAVTGIDDGVEVALR